MLESRKSFGRHGSARPSSMTKFSLSSKTFEGVMAKSSAGGEAAAATAAEASNTASAGGVRLVRLPVAGTPSND